MVHQNIPILFCLAQNFLSYLGSYWSFDWVPIKAMPLPKMFGLLTFPVFVGPSRIFQKCSLLSTVENFSKIFWKSYRMIGIDRNILKMSKIIKIFKNWQSLSKIKLKIFILCLKKQQNGPSLTEIVKNFSFLPKVANFRRSKLKLQETGNFVEKVSKKAIEFCKIWPNFKTFTGI